MDGNATGTVIQAIATVVALVGVAVTFVLTSRGQRQDRELSRLDAERAERAEAASAASAERSERAAALSIDTLTRIAVALEGIEAKRTVGIRGEPPRAAVAWSLAHVEGDTFVLENQGDAAAFDVRLSADDSLIAASAWPPPQNVGPGETLPFTAERTEATTDSTITVEWAQAENGTSNVWRYPLPAGTPR